MRPPQIATPAPPGATFRQRAASAWWGLSAWPLALGLRLFTGLAQATLSVSVEGPGASYRGPALYVNWHRYLPYLVVHHGRARRWLMVSRDAYLAPVVLWNRLHGVRVIRGGTGDGGRTALAEMVQRLRAGDSAFLAVDGPRGPPLQVKRGCVDMARAAQVPLIPVGYASQRGRFSRRRWDHWLMVRPLDKLTVRYGTPLFFQDEEPVARALSRVAEGLATVCDSSANPSAGEKKRPDTHEGRRAT